MSSLYLLSVRGSACPAEAAAGGVYGSDSGTVMSLPLKKHTHSMCLRGTAVNLRADYSKSFMTTELMGLKLGERPSHGQRESL